jgi:hypothetical protein
VILLSFLLTPALAQKPDKYAQLEDKARTAQDGKRGELLGQLARLDFQRAKAAYDAGQVAAGAQQLALMRQHGEQAMGVLNDESAQRKTHGMKHVEIDFREIAFGLRDLSRSLTIDERPPIESALKYFSDARDQILRMMFGGKI